MKIAVLTSGGDSAGMNAVVRSVVKMAIAKGCEAWVVREGYEGLVRGNAQESSDSRTVKEDASFVHNLRFGDGELLKDGTGDYISGRTIKGRYIVRGGTLIGTARSTTFRTQEGRQTAAYNMIKEGIDALVVCGGDGSLTGADVFRSEWPKHVEALRAAGKITDEQVKNHHHLRIVGLVGSIDNDMSMTDLTIGAVTALHRICESIDNINSTAVSHSRAFVVEVMGRHCGWLALMAGASCGADFIFIPEDPPSEDNWEDSMCKMIQTHRDIGQRKTIVIVAEGAIDKDLKPIRAEYVKDVLAERLGLDTRVTTLGHTQRGGAPAAYDRIMPTLQGIEAVDALLESTPDTPSYMIGISENKVTRVPLMEAVALTRSVGTAISEKNFKKAMSLRDPEFAEMLEGFYATSVLLKEPMLPHHLRMRVGIMHVGAPAGGMNAATRTAVRYCLRQGHKPFAIHSGFPGLLEDNVHPLSWLGVDNWMTRGGSELGTNRKLPDIDLGAVAAKFQQHNFHALLLIGGFEAFHALSILEAARKNYPAFQIPMVHLPATISNNVPVMEYSLGSDTSLNALVTACDAIKQSASASRNRVFVCGYIATMGALATGAVIVYTPERGIDLDMLRRDVRFLKRRFALDQKGKAEGRLVLRNESSSDVYSTDFIRKMFKEEGGSLFDSRAAMLGHTLQGGIPSPLDRTRAVRLALKCMSFVEEHHQALLRQQGRKLAPPESAAVITIQGTAVKWVPVTEMVTHADMHNRRGKEAWWAPYTDLVEMIVARQQLLDKHLPVDI
ncbi:PFK protein [Fomitopsis serialis]|uniref:PFK protein n=1 Tax=Fomitopsis serialis TaxID=139415 RepID=UPI002008C593|nr:PFK protein [Neoantrodia serialis]KAH9928295.1 PFK protein [Neoantrodia serialis]